MNRRIRERLKGAKELKTVLTIVFAMTISFGGATAEPLSGNLIGQNSDFIKFNCSVLSNGDRECGFVQVLVTNKRSQESIDGYVADNLKGMLNDWSEEEVSEFCSDMTLLAPVYDALESGNLDTAKSLANSLSTDERDLSVLADKLDDFGAKELEDATNFFGALQSLCKDPGAATFSAYLRLQAEREARTCDIYVNQWTDTYRRVSGEVWSIVQGGPEGVCGVVRLDRFQCDSGSGLLCDFIAEKRILNPEGQGMLACDDLDETPTRYSWRPKESYLACDILNF